MECDLHRTPYQGRFKDYSGQEHLTASRQPEKVLEEHLQDGALREAEDYSLKYSRCLQYSAMKSSGAC